MKKIITVVFKKICFAFIILYSFNVTASALSIFIPINYSTLTIVGLLGFPGLFSIVALSFMI